MIFMMIMSQTWDHTGAFTLFFKVAGVLAIVSFLSSVSGLESHNPFWEVDWDGDRGDWGDEEDKISDPSAITPLPNTPM